MDKVKRFKIAKITPETITELFQILSDPTNAKAICEILKKTTEQRNLTPQVILTSNNFGNKILPLPKLKIRKVISRTKHKDRIYKSEKYFVNIPLSVVKALNLKEGDYLSLIKLEKDVNR